MSHAKSTSACSGKNHVDRIAIDRLLTDLDRSQTIDPQGQSRSDRFLKSSSYFQSRFPSGRFFTVFTCVSPSIHDFHNRKISVCIPVTLARRPEKTHSVYKKTHCSTRLRSIKNARNSTYPTKFHFRASLGFRGNLRRVPIKKAPPFRLFPQISSVNIPRNRRTPIATYISTHVHIFARLAFHLQTPYHRPTKEMKMLIILLGIASALALTAVTSVAADAGKSDKGPLRHVVAFKFKDSASKEDIKKVETAFHDLQKKIKEIVSYEWGMNNSTEGLNKGCTHGFILTFKNEKDRDVYLKHPDHQEFGKLVGPLLAEVFVIDFFAQK